MLMMRPQPRSTMPSQTCLVMLKHESRLVRMTASQSALSIFLNVMSRVMPALLTSTSTGPTSPSDLRDACDARVVVDDVARIGAKLVALLLHRCEPLLRLGVARRVRGDDLVAERGQLDADRFAQPAHAAGDQRDPRRIERHLETPPSYDGMAGTIDSAGMKCRSRLRRFMGYAPW